ncbi:hypothetical protein [Nonomuraea sp. CA-141351]|uniref:hypothetical protein n=1 Tax=Nonomuraea sp. CA-141351 TaxID=3239996 RepID=UPI003D93F86B
MSNRPTTRQGRIDPDLFKLGLVLVLGVGLFTAGSGLCAAAWDAGSLITFRVVQGAAGALLMPVAQTILARAAGSERMGRVMTLAGLPALLITDAGTLGALLPPRGGTVPARTQPKEQ